jgi:hypothetical protein
METEEIKHSSADFDKEKYGINLGVWQQGLTYISDDLKMAELI